MNNDNHLSQEAKKLIKKIAGMMSDLSDEHGRITQDSIKKGRDKLSDSKLSEKLTRISAEIDNFAYFLEKNNFEMNNPELDRFATSIYYTLVSSLPIQYQRDKLTLVSILIMIKLAAFTSFEAGKVGLEEKKEKSENMLKDNGFEKELKKGFDLKEWKNIVKSEEE